MPTQTSQQTMKTLSNGLQLVVEPVDSAASAAVRWLTPAGHASDDESMVGVTTMLSEMIMRGAGGKTSRELSDAFDRLGVQRSADLQARHLSVSAMMLGDKLDEAMPLVVDVVRRPALSPDSLEPVRQLCQQSLQGMDDDPQHRAMLYLREYHRPAPFNRSGYGEVDALASMTIDDIRAMHASRVCPGGSIVSVAGAVDPGAVEDLLESLMEGWVGVALQPESDGSGEGGVHHIEMESQQVHIGVACHAPPEPDPSSMLERLAIAVLSGGSSCRLFTEVRQKRSLCYSVGASYAAGRDRGLVSLYAGTTPERAQETLDVSLAEFERLREGVTEEEFSRAVIRLKSGLVMQGESTAARASRNAGDAFKLGRVRGLDEITATIDALTLDALNAYVATRDWGAFTVVGLGPTKLDWKK